MIENQQLRLSFEKVGMIGQLTSKKKEQKSIIIYNLKCEKCSSSFEMSYGTFLKRKERLLCKKCTLSEAYYRGQEKRLKTLNEKYGVSSNLHIKSVEQTIKNGWAKKYGVDNPAKSAVVKERIKCSISNQTDEQKHEAHAKAVQTKRKKNNGEYFSKEAIEKINVTLIEKYGSIENAYKQREQKIRQIFQEKYGTPYPLMFYSHKKYCYDNKFFDSSWELAYYIWLKDGNTASSSFEYHPQDGLDYIGDDGNQHTYYPDFIVDGKIVEIKGDYFFDENGQPFNKYTKRSWKAKYDLIIQNGGKILRFEDVKPILKYVKEKYGANFLKDMKVKFND